MRILNMEIQPHDSSPGWRNTVYCIIFESDTRSGRTFDIVLLAAILLSVAP